MLQVGDIRIHCINDADVKVDPGGAFGLVPRALWQRHFEPDDEQLLPMIQMCLLVRSGDRNIVVDTGLGDRLNEKQRRQWRLSRPRGGLLEGLQRLGLGPADIDLVIDTHLHADHCGGNTSFRSDGSTICATFPNAEYVVQRREYEDAMSPNERTRATYLLDNYQPLKQSGQLRLLDGGAELAPGVRVEVAPGHTPGHMCVVFESQGACAAYVCDLASYAVHFEKLGWMTAYDVEPLITLETKRRWQRWALENEAAVIFPHDPKRPAGHLKEDENGRLRLEKIEIGFA